MPSLSLLTGPSAGLKHPLSTETTLGRSPSCDIPLDDEKVSRRHVQLVLEGGRVLLRDLGSRNGTWMDGVRVEREMELHPGACFQLGETMIRLEAPAVADAPREPAREVASASLDRLISENAVRELVALSQALGAAPDRSALFARLSERLGASLGASSSLCVGLNEASRIPEALANPARAGELALAKGELCAPLIDDEGAVAGLYYLRREGAFGVGEQSQVAAATRLASSFLYRRGDFDREADAPAPGLSAALAEAKRLLETSGRVLLIGEPGAGKGLLARMLMAAHGTSESWAMVDSRAAASAERLAHDVAAGWIVLEIDGLSPSGARRLAEIVQEDPTRKLVATLGAAASVPWRSQEMALWRDLDASRVKIPSLHERPEDLPGLFARFAERAARRRHQPPCRLGKSAREALTAMRFERNVSELKLFAERLSLLHPGLELTEAHLGPGGAPQRAGKLDERVGALEREAIAAALREARGKKVHAAAILGISRPTLDKKIQLYGLTVQKGESST